MDNSKNIFGNAEITQQDFETMPIERKKIILNVIFEKFINMLLQSDQPKLGDIGRAMMILRNDERNSPNGLLWMQTDSLEIGLNHIVDRIGFREGNSLREEFFGPYLENAARNPDSKTFTIFANGPINPMAIRVLREKLAVFPLLTAVIFNTNLITCNNPRELAFYIVSSMSLLRDFYVLQAGIAKGEVYFGALDNLYDLCVKRANSAVKAFIDNLNTELGENTYEGVPANMLQFVEEAEPIDTLPKVEEYFHNIIKGTN